MKWLCFIPIVTTIPTQIVFIIDRNWLALTWSVIAQIWMGVTWLKELEVDRLKDSYPWL